MNLFQLQINIILRFRLKYCLKYTVAIKALDVALLLSNNLSLLFSHAVHKFLIKGEAALLQILNINIILSFVDCDDDDGNNNNNNDNNNNNNSVVVKALRY